MKNKKKEEEEKMMKKEEEENPPPRPSVMSQSLCHVLFTLLSD